MHWDPEMEGEYRKLFKNKPPLYIEIDALVTSKPRHECSIFRDEIREEVVVTGVLYKGNLRDTYIIRFVHKKCIEQAKRLVPGTRIHVEKGRFDHRKGRKGAEFQVKFFSLVDNSADASNSSSSSSQRKSDLVFLEIWDVDVSV